MANIKTDNNLKERLINSFKEYEAKLNGEKNSELFKVRKSAFEYFESIGFPTLKNEYWKYTNLAFLNKLNLKLSQSEIKEIPKSAIEENSYDNSEANLAVVINGKFSEEYSKITTSDSIVVKSFAKALSEDKEAVQEYYGKVISLTNNPFAAINTAFANDGIYINAKRNHVEDKLLHILYINDARDEQVLSNPRKLIIAGESSELSIIETSITLGEHPSLINSASEVIVNPNAKVNYYKIQDDKENSYYVGTTNSTVDRDAVFNKTTITLGGKFVRNNLNALIKGQNAESNFYGLFLGFDNSFIDNHTFVDHAVANCQSNEDYKGILDDKAIAVFNGKILVRQDAQQTNAYQSNKNILLSDWASINTKPELEIYADDVKCSHGATSGSLDKDMLFYLQARGIDKKQAKGILLNSFAKEITSQIEFDKIREMIEEKVARKLEIN